MRNSIFLLVVTKPRNLFFFFLNKIFTNISAVDVESSFSRVLKKIVGEIYLLFTDELVILVKRRSNANRSNIHML